jgi:hypothetical protein
MAAPKSAHIVQQAMNRALIVPLVISTGLLGGAVYWSHNHDPRDTIGRASWLYYHTGRAARAVVDPERGHNMAIRALQWVRICCLHAYISALYHTSSSVISTIFSL